MAAYQVELNLFLNYTSTTGTYNMVERDVVIVCDTSGAGVTVNLISASSTGEPGRCVNIKDNGNANNNNITIVPDGGDTIDGETSLVIFNNYDCITLVSDGSSAWYII